MKKIALALIASAFTFGAFAQSAPVASEAGAKSPTMVKTAAKHKKTAKKHVAKKHAAKSTT
ncbi:MAG: hypothetical protein JWQ11_3673 [Rhizobacter sp.]|nr:hypothetical protein [Rhizobacter sp.]